MNAAIFAPDPAPSPSARTWNEHQLRIFEDVRSGVGHTVILARAGTGKTTTIVEALKRLPPGCSVLVVAFNKSIATELQGRVPKGVTVLTLHSYGLKAITAALGRVRIEGDKVRDRLGRTLDMETPRNRALGYATLKATSLCKASLASSREQIEDVLDAFGILDGEDLDAGRAADVDEVVALVQEALNYSKESTATIDFDDMIWLPHVLGLKTPTFDRVFVDEAQDLNPAQIQLALKAAKARTGRITCVGDDRQAIYRFRGADEQAITRIVDALDAKTLPLSVTYRCGKRIVAAVQQIVPDYQAAPSNPEGEVYETTSEEMQRRIKPGDFLLSRTNAPLVPLCLRFLRQGIKARISGRDVGTGLVALVKNLRAKGVEGLVEKVGEWSRREVARLEKKQKDPQAIIDKADTILAFCEGARSVPEVIERIEKIFSDLEDGNAITLSTTHKAKGLERDRVFLLRDTYKPGLSTEEDNLFYVAATRAKTELALVRTKGGAS